ncbi:hypothetical protein GCM10020256_05540 [Streptomyces thermocoprophilus]
MASPSACSSSHGARFYAASRRAAVRRAVGVLLLGLGLSVLVGWGLVELFPGTLPAGQRLGWAANRVLGGLVDAGSFDGRPPRALFFLLGLFGALALLNAAATLFRSQRLEAALHDDEELRIRALLGRYGDQDSLGYFATRRDKAVVFSPSGKAAITYRVEAGVCLASGDPVGDREAWPHAIDAWLGIARAYAWVPAVMGASEDGATAYARAGLGALQLGDEAIVHVARFDLNGRDMRVARQAVHRVRRTGATCRIRRHAALTDTEMEEIVRKADAWRDTETERGFSMALDRLGDPADGDCLLVEAFDSEGRLLALLSFVPWGRDGISLDLMRRDRDAAPNGVMEFMVAELCAAAPKLGVRRISLNFAVFRSVFEEGARIGAGPVLRMWRRLLLFLSKWWQLEALYRSNAKYRPEWYPRFLCYGDAAALARIGLASGIAEGFVSVPSLRRLRGHGHPKGARRPATTEGLPPLSALGLAGGTRPGPPTPTRACRNRSASATAPSTGCAPRASTPTRSASRPAPTPSPRSARATGSPSRAGSCWPATSAGSSSSSCATGPATTSSPSPATTPANPPSPGSAPTPTSATTSPRPAGQAAAARANPPCSSPPGSSPPNVCAPLPDKRRGLTDPEAKVRMRYLDLVTSPAARDVVRARSTAVQALRQGLLERGYLEVETPMLQQIHGGANARPFTTHINAYDLDLYLRIAPRAVSEEAVRRRAGEGLRDGPHLPQRGRLLQAQPRVHDAGGLPGARRLRRDARPHPRTHPGRRRRRVRPARRPQGRRGARHLRHLARQDRVRRHLRGPRREIDPGTDLARLHLLCDRADVPYTADDGHGDVVLEMYERLVEERTKLPTFYKDFPTDVSPLTRQHRTDPRLAERWDLVAFGTELGTAYSELTDPVEQRRRLTAQSLLAAGGDPEAMELDEDFLDALEYAMPPTGGLGIGVDRLVMFLTGLTIRETLPFPLVRRR